MTTLKDKMASAMAKMYASDLFGDEAVYTPAGGQPQTLQAVIEHGAGEESDGADDLGQIARVRIRACDVAAVKAGDMITNASEAWEILWGRKSTDGLEWICNVSRR